MTTTDIYCSAAGMTLLQTKGGTLRSKYPLLIPLKKCKLLHVQIYIMLNTIFCEIFPFDAILHLFHNLIIL
jgi:hypothetical protein